MSSNSDSDTNAGQPKYISKGLSALWMHGARESSTVYDVVIVGSGYGGSVAASELAKAPGASICILERGREYLPGEFPSRFGELPAHLRAAQQNTGQVSGNHEGLFDVRLGDDVVALVANGLGGGSLINAGVMLEPRPGELDHATLRAVLEDAREKGLFKKALAALGGAVPGTKDFIPNTIELNDAPRLRKTEALFDIAKGSGLEAELACLTISMNGGPNSAGVELKPCARCGDCMTGCNVGAKDSLDANLLHRAAAGKVEIYTGASVLSLLRSHPTKDGSARHWVLRVAHTNPRLQQREDDLFFIRARRVVLAAGTLGSTEILLRSRDDKHVFSTRLGEGFSCNGDNLAAAYDLAQDTKTTSDEDTPLKERAVGPTITATLPVKVEGQRSFQVQEFAVPAPMRRLFEEIVTTSHALHTLPDADESVHGKEGDDALDPMAVDPGRMGRTLLLGVIGHDAARGSLNLANPVRPLESPPQQGALRITWPQARQSSELEVAHEKLKELVGNLPEPNNANLIANPMWRLLPPALEALVAQPRGPVLTVHPLGGCAMGESMHDGVVDQYGRVFNGAPGGKDDWFGSLVVLDGAIIPQSLGVNPALTITTVAMRAMHWLQDKGGWPAANSQHAATVGGVPVAVPRAMVAPARVPVSTSASTGETEVEVVERLRGAVSIDFGPGHPQRWIAELTLAYKPAEVRSLMSTLRRSLKLAEKGSHCRLRLYTQHDWDTHQLRIAPEEARAPYLKLEARLTGSLSFLHRDKSTSMGRRWQGFSAWLRNRGMRDMWQARFADKETSKGQESSAGLFQTARRKLRELLDLASRAGEVRLFDYDLTVGNILKNEIFGPNQERQRVIADNARIRGEKRLTYDRRSNPWTQLTELTLTEMPGLLRGPSPVLSLDLRFLVGQGLPLLRITQQRNQAQALLDLMSFGLYLTRVLVSIHLWTFRKPDTARSDEPSRLPENIAGLAPPIITELTVDRVSETNEPIKVRLTRYAAVKDKGLPALVMIHGYSVSGNTFTHPSLDPSAAKYFCSKNREVWVVDLRTSSAMPTATHPWALEQPALIDLPAALLHVRNATGRPVDVLAHCIGCAMLSMAILTDARKIRTSETQLGIAAWLTSEHLGTLTAFNGADPQGGAHPTIRTIVLSQKGPVLRYTDDNVFRAFVMQYARRWLLNDDYQFRPSRRQTVSEDLLDRLLSSVPYPAADYDIANPLRPWARTSWTATRHRMDALYGRDFSADNLLPKTLEAIDDLFGPINLETVSQTIHFARFNAITNQQGRGEFVTLGRLQRRWSGIPTLAIHGQDNGLVDVATQTLLEKVMTASGVPFRRHTYEGMGHQDVLIGRQTKKVFDDVEAFFADPPVAEVPPEEVDDPPVDVVVDIPWVGPRIDAFPDQGRGSIRLGVISRPDQGEAALFLVPAVWHVNAEIYTVLDLPDAIVGSPAGPNDEWLFATPNLDEMPSQLGDDELVPGWLALIFYPLDETTAHAPLVKPTKLQPAAARQAWISTPEVPEPARPAPTNGGTSIADGVERSNIGVGAARLVRPPPPPEWLSAYVTKKLDLKFGKDGDVLATDVMLPAGVEWTDMPAGTTKNLSSLEIEALKTDDATRADLAKVANEVLKLAKKWLVTLKDDPLLPKQCFVRRADVQRAADQRRASVQSEHLRFAVASCQYSQGLIDRPVAQASLRQLSKIAGKLDVVLFLGDQIYADATAGLVDPTRRDELFDQPHEKALRVEPMREVLRRVPAHFLLDDHELSDNWEPLAETVTHTRPALAKKTKNVRRDGFRAYRRYQRVRRRHQLAWPDGPADFDFTSCGYKILMLDTRTGRSPRGSLIEPTNIGIISPDQWDRLVAWLQGPAGEVKFIATPSMLLPRRRDIADDPSHEPSSDSWDGFRPSLEKMLAHIADSEIRNLVFLSGDEHHSLSSEIWLQRKGKSAVKVVSIHSSGLYAPFPFANGRPDELVQHDTFSFGDLSVVVNTTFAPPGDGFAVVDLDNSGQEPRLLVDFVKAGGGSHQVPVELRGQPPLPMRDPQAAGPTTLVEADTASAEQVDGLGSRADV